MEPYRVVSVDSLFKEGRPGGDARKKAQMIQDYLNTQFKEGWVYRGSVNNTITEGFSAGYTESFLVLQLIPQSPQGLSGQ